MAGSNNTTESQDVQSRSLLTVEYIFALGSVVVATLLVSDIVTSLFTIWTKGTPTFTVTGWISQLIPQLSTNSSAALVSAAVFAVILGLLGLLLFRRVSREIAARPGYTSRIAYRVPTYAAFSGLLIPAIILVGKMVGVLINSLLFIGVSGAGEIYKAFYLQEFVPYLVSLGFILAITFLVYRIINGVNVSRTLTWTVLGGALAVLLAAAITVSVVVHDDSSHATPSVQIPQIDDYFRSSGDSSF